MQHIPARTSTNSHKWLSKGLRVPSFISILNAGKRRKIYGKEGEKFQQPESLHSDINYTGFYCSFISQITLRQSPTEQAVCCRNVIWVALIIVVFECLQQWARHLPEAWLRYKLCNLLCGVRRLLTEWVDSLMSYVSLPGWLIICRPEDAGWCEVTWRQQALTSVWPGCINYFSFWGHLLRGGHCFLVMTADMVLHSISVLCLIV